MDRIGSYVTMLGNTPAILISSSGRKRFGQKLEHSLESAGMEPRFTEFGGECSHEEIDRQVAALKHLSIDCLIAVGGGKCIDACKCIAARLQIPVVNCPTLASTDAPCSAVSVIYTASGRFKDVEFFSSNPALVVIDTEVIARAPLRYLLAGMADTLATGYEATTCFNNSNARSMLGGKITLAAAAIAKLSTDTIYNHATKAIESVKCSSVNQSLEHIVEANTLLSGIGFESGGLAAAHAIATALTTIPHVDENFLHGEMVALGLLTQLVLESNTAEYDRVSELFIQLGLPITFSQLSLSLDNTSDLEQIANVACSLDFMANEPFSINPEKISNAMLEVERLGRNPA